MIMWQRTNENNKSFNLFTKSSYIDKYTVDKDINIGIIKIII